MASDKFGNNPVAPLYNATGRNPRDVEMGTPGKGLGSVGSSGAGGKDFGISNQPPKKADLGSNLLSPLNPYNMLYGNPIGGRRRRGGGGGGGEVEYDIDAMERIAKAQTPTSNVFAPQAGGNQDNRGMYAQIAENGKQVIDAQYTEKGDNNSGITQTMTTADTPPADTPPGAQPANTRKGVKRTEEQKAATAATRAEKRAANPNYGKRNPNRPERTQSPIARKPRSASAKSGNQPMTTATQRVSNITQTQTLGGNFS